MISVVLSIILAVLSIILTVILNLVIHSGLTRAEAGDEADTRAELIADYAGSINPPDKIELAELLETVSLLDP
jgi:hypothetical protein